MICESLFVLDVTNAWGGTVGGWGTRSRAPWFQNLSETFRYEEQEAEGMWIFLSRERIPYRVMDESWLFLSLVRRIQWLRHLRVSPSGLRCARASLVSKKKGKADGLRARA